MAVSSNDAIARSTQTIDSWEVDGIAVSQGPTGIWRYDFTNANWDDYIHDSEENRLLPSVGSRLSAPSPVPSQPAMLLATAEPTTGYVGDDAHFDIAVPDDGDDLVRCE